jgi:competence ComEA-like helix-hairpin-helix protein
MSERIRKGIGLLLLAAGLGLTIIPTAASRETGKKGYQAGNRDFVPEAIGTERNGPVKINEADDEELQRLKGIGPAYAGRILEERQENGPFYYPEDLEAVSGIGPQTLTGFREMLDMTVKEREN